MKPLKNFQDGEETVYGGNEKAEWVGKQYKTLLLLIVISSEAHEE